MRILELSQDLRMSRAETDDAMAFLSMARQEVRHLRAQLAVVESRAERVRVRAEEQAGKRERELRAEAEGRERENSRLREVIEGMRKEQEDAVATTSVGTAREGSAGGRKGGEGASQDEEGSGVLLDATDGPHEDDCELVELKEGETGEWVQV